MEQSERACARAPIDYIPYTAATVSMPTPEEFQAWLDSYGDSVTTVATEKVDGANTRFWVTRVRGGEDADSEPHGHGGYTKVALLSKHSALYTTRVYDDNGTGTLARPLPTTTFQADRSILPVPTSSILALVKKGGARLLQKLVAVYRSFTAAKPECDQIIICGETLHNAISDKIAYAFADSEPHFVAFGLQFKLSDSGRPGVWFWSDWHEGHKHITRAGLEHVRQLDVPRVSVADLRHLVENRISDYASADANARTSGERERRAEGLIFRTRGESAIRVDDAETETEAQLVKFDRGSFGLVETLSAALRVDKVKVGDYFESVPLCDWIEHAETHGRNMWDVFLEGHEGMALDIQEEVLKRAKAAMLDFSLGEGGALLKIVREALEVHYAAEAKARIARAKGVGVNQTKKKTKGSRR